MMCKRRAVLLVATLIASSSVCTRANAQVLWSALQTKPKPNMIIAYDVSTTMQIEPAATPPSCGSFLCHAQWGGKPNAPWSTTRLEQATGEMLTALDIFRDSFVYGGLRYDTCGPWGTYGSYTGGEWAGHCPGSCVGDCYDDDGGYTTYALPSGANCDQGGSAGEAEVSFMTPPDNTSPATEVASFNNVVQMIKDIQTYPNTINVQGAVNPNGPTQFLACEHGEGHVPGTSATPTGLVPTGYPGGSTAFVSSLLGALGGGSGAVPGLSLNGVPSNLLSQTCDTGTPLGGSTVSSLLNFGSISFPTPGCNPSYDDMVNLCAQITAIYGNLLSLANNCFDTTLPANAWITNLAPPTCDPVQLSSGNALCGNCGSGAGTVFHDSCVCDPNQPGCLATGVNNCGIPWQYRSRQQMAICAAGDNTPNAYPTFGGAMTSIGDAFRNQVDNVVRGGVGTCRENAVVFVTDGFAGDQGGVPPQADQMARGGGSPAQTGYLNKPFYSPLNQVSNAWVFATSNSYAFAADPMAVSLGQAHSLPATDQVTLNTSFSKVLNRVEKGHFYGSNVALDSHSTRLAVMSYSVPGHYAPGGVETYPDERYFGHPTRISWFQMDPATGARGPLVCETDWKSRVPLSGVKLLRWDNTFSSAIPAKEHVTIGPPTGPTDTTAAWLKAPSDPGASPMYAEVPDDGSTDRGNGFVPSGVAPGRIGACAAGGNDCYVYGYMLNGGSTQPVVVEAPHDVPAGLDAAFLKFEFDATGPAPHRPRAIYSVAGGYLFAHNGGDYSSAPATVGNVHLTSSYDDSGTSACTELFRFLPSWTDQAILAEPNAQCPTCLLDPSFPGDALRAPGHQFPDLLSPQHYTEGQIAVHEARLKYTPGPTPPSTDFATVLIMTQGWAGPNFSVLDVTDPSAPTVIGENRLPLPSAPVLSNYTTAEPTMYSFPSAIAGEFQTVAVFTGGDRGAAELYSYTISRSGVYLLDSIALPPGNYPSSAVCFDATSSGASTDCAVLSDRGRLARVKLDRATGKFASVVDLSPSYAAALSIGPGERFYSHPAVYFESDGAVAYVFGSGDIKNINSAPIGANHMYKVKESNLSTSSTANATSVCTAVGGTGTASGRIDLGSANEIITAPPIVAGGVVAWTTYSPPTNGCGDGEANLYAMNYSSCFDAITAGSTARPPATPVGTGIPMSPAYLRSSDSLVVQTTAHQPTTVQVNGKGSGATNKSRNGMVSIYWRPELKAL